MEPILIRCPHCGQRKPRKEMARSKPYWCLDCKSERNREYQQAHKAERAEYMRWYRRQVKYHHSAGIQSQGLDMRDFQMALSWIPEEERPEFVWLSPSEQLERATRAGYNGDYK